MSTGRVIIVEGYSRSLILNNPNTLFAFDDNLAAIGYVGQAEHCRGCKNAVGIPTKISPTQHLFDLDILLDMDRFKFPIIKVFVKLREHLRTGADIAWPKEGVGRDDISRLYITGPTVLLAIEALKTKVFSEAVSVVHDKHQ